MPSSAPAAADRRSAYTVGQHLGAWAVHALTMSGIVWAVLALLALLRQDLLAMWGWLAVALVVDGLDGTLARRAEVSQRIPWFDGTALDTVVDYLTWTFIPALFLYLHIPFGPAPMPLLMMLLINVSSLFCYCNKGMKSSDYYFVGFPAAWNIVAVYLWLLDTGPVFNVIATIVLSALTLAPIDFLHPFRVRRLMAVNILAVAAWLAGTIWLVLAHPDAPLPAQLIWWLGGGWFFAVSLLRTIRGRADDTSG
ncbi:CDP-alcohol phosphatidyltransferase family protein [Enemella evansiae]|uniref:CDP-alcohol phosphatidyltransferase family protein n=1 Tax=Enemella evansiae TaxID=2016499 RepID=UPI001414EB68|nr:CDP-alcohol phosphatidyltransferase family protein [Enemella evansiae]